MERVRDTCHFFVQWMLLVLGSSVRNVNFSLKR